MRYHDCGKLITWGRGPVVLCAKCGDPICAPCRREALESDEGFPPRSHVRVGRRCQLPSEMGHECGALLCVSCSPAAECRPCKDRVEKARSGCGYAGGY